MGKIEKKPSIATIAFHRAINYGALLQVYALQTKIEELGGKCTILDYRNKILEAKHKEIAFKNCKGFTDYIRYVFLAKNHNKKFKSFRKFSKTYLNLSKSYNDIEQLAQDNELYDKYITGSDQVWNGNITNTDPAYFLDFVKDSMKKNSYAASFGFKEIPEGKKNTYYRMLKDYKNMLVRERQGADIIKKLLNRNIEVVLDPTLLITKEEWYELATNYSKHKNYILIYGFGGSDTHIEFARNLSKKTGYKIVHIANPYLQKLGFVYEKSVGPKEFLELFKNASYIVTNSFHGTAFSINFNKEFFIEMLPVSQQVNSRLEDILDLFNLRNRQITNTDVSIAENRINYTEVNRILQLERSKSIKLLNNIIHN